jgi:hypothetical protein
MYERIEGPLGHARTDMLFAWLAMYTAAPYRKEGTELRWSDFLPPFGVPEQVDEEFEGEGELVDGRLQSDDQV